MLLELITLAAGVTGSAIGIAEWLSARKTKKQLQEKQFVVDHLASALLGEESKEEAAKVFHGSRPMVQREPFIIPVANFTAGNAPQTKHQQKGRFMGLELKHGDQIIVAVDNSGSMGEVDAACGNTRKYSWMRETMEAYVKAAMAFDPDGISIHFFNSGVSPHADVKTLDEVKRLFSANSTGGSTATHKVVETAWAEHTSKKSQGTYLMIFTDGDASDRAALKNQIIAITKKVSSPEEFRIVFLPIGTVSNELRGFLDDLDQNLGKEGAKFDIVSIVNPGDADFEGAINKAIAGTTSVGDVADGSTIHKRTQV